MIKSILKNKSPKLVYIWINNDKVEIRDASHLRGKGSLETAELLREEVHERRRMYFHRSRWRKPVFTASIEQGRSSASRLGGGAVMGDKNVKAIVVRGTKDVNLARGDEFIKHLNKIHEYIKYRTQILSLES